MKNWYVVVITPTDGRVNLLNYLNDEGITPDCIKMDRYYIYYYHTKELPI